MLTSDSRMTVVQLAALGHPKLTLYKDLVAATLDDLILFLYLTPLLGSQMSWFFTSTDWFAEPISRPVGVVTSFFNVLDHVYYGRCASIDSWNEL